jgi:hypothetical protein
MNVANMILYYPIEKYIPNLYNILSTLAEPWPMHNISNLPCKSAHPLN